MTPQEAEQLIAENRRLREENRLLREKVDLLVRKVFGASSEKLDANQLLVLEAEARKEDEACAAANPEAQADDTNSGSRLKSRKAPRLPEDLPVEERVLDPEEVRRTPRQWRCIGREVSEQLDYRPGRFCRVRTIRRKFFEARERAPSTAGWILRQIAHLYRIERRLREAKAGPNLRQATRSAHAQPIYRRLHRALVRLKTSRRFLPQSGLGRAIDYALGQWPALGVFLQNGHVEIDNNNAENAIRPVAVGRKNFLFIGAEDAGWRSAVLYSVIASCRRRGIEPMTYLTDVLARLPVATNHTVAKLTPANWAKEHRPCFQQAA